MYSGRAVTWYGALDFGKAARNLHTEFHGDWYRDPWSWPEIAWAVAERPPSIIREARVDRCPSRCKDPRSKRGLRHAPSRGNFPPLDRLVYQALVDVSSRTLIGDLPWWAYGWRLPRNEPTGGDYSPSSTEWKLYRTWLSRLAGEYSFGLVTDVVSFFASVPVDRVKEDIQSVVGGRVAARLGNLLDGWSRVPGRSGLPQRSTASSVLANRYLRPLDDTLAVVSRAAARGSKGPTCVRWMDDIWVFGSDRGELRRGQVQIASALRDLKLNTGVGKTHVLTGDELADAARQIERSAVDAGLNKCAQTEPLDALLHRIKSAPESASRTSIRFALTRIREKELWGLVGGLLEVADRMPHGADHLGRLFRDAGRAGDLVDWFLAYVESPWECFDWSVSQLASMFPSAGQHRGWWTSCRAWSRRIGSYPLPQLRRNVWRLGTLERLGLCFVRPRKRRRIRLSDDRSASPYSGPGRNINSSGPCLESFRRIGLRSRCSKQPGSGRPHCPPTTDD